MTIFFAAISQDYEESFRLQDFFFLSTQCCRSILALFLSSINQIQQQDICSRTAASYELILLTYLFSSWKSGNNREEIWSKKKTSVF